MPTFFAAGMEFTCIPSGTFSMGSSMEEVEKCCDYWQNRLLKAEYPSQFKKWIMKEYPKHTVQIQSFSIGKYPVTNFQYIEYLREMRFPRDAYPQSILRKEGQNHPVWGVSFEDASAFAKWFSIRSQLNCRLPSEAEWEFAARGESNNEYPFGTVFDRRLCNTIESEIRNTTPVDFYPSGASVFGVWDMAGNVEEWTSDCYQPYLGGEVIEDDLYNVHGEYQILRGGCFMLGGDLARCARRHGPHADASLRFVGFRLVSDGAI